MTNREDARSGWLPRVGPDVNMGQIITWVIIVIATSTIYMGKVDTAQSDTKTLKTDLAALEIKLTANIAATKIELVQQVTQLQLNNDKQFTLTRASIDNIPSMNERVSQLDKRADKMERVLEETRASGIETTANMNNLLRQMGAAQRIPR